MVQMTPTLLEFALKLLRGFEKSLSGQHSVCQVLRGVCVTGQG